MYEKQFVYHYYILVLHDIDTAKHTNLWKHLQSYHIIIFCNFTRKGLRSPSKNTAKLQFCCSIFLSCCTWPYVYVWRRERSPSDTWHMSKPVITFVFKVLRNGLLACTYLTHVQTCDNVRVLNCFGMDCSGTYLTHVQTCGNVCVQSTTEWTASVHIWP